MKLSYRRILIDSWAPWRSCGCDWGHAFDDWKWWMSWDSTRSSHPDLTPPDWVFWRWRDRCWGDSYWGAGKFSHWLDRRWWAWASWRWRRRSSWGVSFRMHYGTDGVWYRGWGCSWSCRSLIICKYKYIPVVPSKQRYLHPEGSRNSWLTK